MIIANNEFKREGTKYIANILTDNRTLKSFNLSKKICKYLGNNQLCAEGAIYIAKQMKNNKSITSLELCIMNINNRQ